MITHIIFDLGGVIFKLDKHQAIDRFCEIGFHDAAAWLDAYEQKGIFGDVEAGRISDEQFRQQLSAMVGREFTIAQCDYAWQGYYGHLPQHNLDALRQLRQSGYRVSLLSNTNPFIMRWARSNAFDGHGNALDHHFDALYLSYEMRMMKPDPRFFEAVLKAEGATPDQTLFIDDGPRNIAAAAALGIHTLQPDNGADWRPDLEALLAQQGGFEVHLNSTHIQ